VATVRKQIEEATSDYDKEKLQERVAKLAGGVAVIRWAPRRSRDEGKKARVEDALHATRAPSRKLVPGGGVALVRAKDRRQAEGRQPRPGCRHQDRPARIEQPMREIARNAGTSRAWW